MPNSITNRQMVFIFLLTLTAVTVVSVPQTMAKAAGVGGWLTLIVTAVLFGFAAYILISLNAMFPGQVLFDYSALLVGKAGSYILGIFYMFYFLATSSYLCAGMGNTLTANFYVYTPAWATILIGMPFYGFTVYKGITNIGRFFEIYGIIFIAAAVTVHVAMLFQGRVDHILPLYIPEDTGRYFQAIPSAMISFIGIGVFTFIPMTKENAKAPGIAFLAVLGVGLFYVLNVESSIMMIGMNEVVNETSALITAIRQLQLPFLGFLERVDVVYLTVGFMGLFAGKAMLYLAVVEFACKLLPGIKRGYIVAAAGAAIFLTDTFILKINNLGELYNMFGIYVGTVASVLIPAALFMVAKVKKHANKLG